MKLESRSLSCNQTINFRVNICECLIKYRLFHDRLGDGTLVTRCRCSTTVVFVAIPSPATQQQCSSRSSEDEEIRHTQEKASVGRQVLPLLSVLKPFFRVMVEKYRKFLQRIIQAWYLFKSTAIIVSTAKKTTGIRPDDAISAYNGGKLNFPWPTENLNFAPRMRMLN